MPALETLSLASLTVGAAAMLRFVWLDSLRFSEIGAEASDLTIISPRTAQGLAMQAEATRALAENESLPRAA